MVKRWVIPDKYKNENFVSFIVYINDLDRKLMSIKDGGSMEEMANYYQLWESHGISLEGLLRFLSNKGCIEIKRKENMVQLHHNNLELLRKEIQRRITRRV